MRAGVSVGLGVLVGLGIVLGEAVAVGKGVWLGRIETIDVGEGAGVHVPVAVGAAVAVGHDVATEGGTAPSVLQERFRATRTRKQAHRANCRFGIVASPPPGKRTVLLPRRL